MGMAHWAVDLAVAVGTVLVVLGSGFGCWALTFLMNFNGFLGPPSGGRGQSVRRRR
ncbi:hypothetical protein ACTMTU_05825 [Streptomyces sp. OZ13]|uniref:hypothetical protein n=1 Tax=Streptomyces sp. OZ13 TaxID=3452210 RepID=UPI003F88FA36